MKHICPLIILLLIGVCAVSCKSNLEKKQEEAQSRLKSFRIDWKISSWSDSLRSVLCTLEYDEQGRLLVYNEDSLRYTFDYSGFPGCIAAACISQKDSSVVSSGVVTTRADGAFLREEKHYEQRDGAAGSATTTGIYAHNEQGRLLHFRQNGTSLSTVNYPDTLDLTLNWGNEDNVKEVRVTTVYPDETRTLIYTIEYMDEEMPCRFYPEVHTAFGMGVEFGVTGINGYSRKNLLKRIAIRFDGDERPYLAFDFVYQYGADGKLTEYLMKVIKMSTTDGSVISADDYIRYYDLIY